MKFVRSSGSFSKLDCNEEQREQLNLITPFLDASSVYGKNKEDSDNLRSLTGGLLLTSNGTDGDYLPNTDDTCTGDNDSTMKCFHSGDSRTSEHLGLTGIHMIFLREHNRIASELKTINGDWNDETLFQETRRIIIAILQHIVYDQFVPSIVGNEGSELYGLVPEKNGYFTGYNSSVNPQLSNEFVTAAMRYGHSVVTNKYERYNKNNQLVDEDLTFSDINFKSEEAYNAEKGGIRSILMGLVNEQCGKFDLSIPDDLQNNLMDEPSGPLFVLAAFNINRGRDHGLPSYVKYAEKCQNIEINGFADLEKANIALNPIKRLEKVYSHVEDIDLWIGGLSESQQGAADVLTGPTFTCIIGEQFKDLKLGDRFYYKNVPNEAHGTTVSAFSRNQLREIKKVSLSTLLCNSLDISTIQPDVFFLQAAIRPNNQKVDCSTYEQMDLSHWTDV